MRKVILCAVAAGMVLSHYACNKKDAPLVLQELNYTENPVDIPNPDRGPYRGRWQSADTPFGITPEVDHRVPVDANSVLYHGRQMPPVEGDDIEETYFHNRAPSVGDTEVPALPSISFMGFDLVNFSSNAFLSAKNAFDYKDDGLFKDPGTGAPRTGTTGPLTPFALDYIRGLLQKVREGNGVALVKFSYDGNGFSYIEPQKYPGLKLTSGLIFGPEPNFVAPNNPSAMCNVPGHEDKDWIQYHVWQLKPIFHEYEDVIMCVKTGMLGPWGEQHSSPVARDGREYVKLLNAYLDAVPASRSLLTHAGAFIAWYNHKYETNYWFGNIETMPVPPKGSPEARFGFFNDSNVAGWHAGYSSWCDGGSLNEGAPMVAPGWDPDLSYEDYDAGKKLWHEVASGFDRYTLLTWVYKQNNIFQGEGGIGNNLFGNMPGAIIEAQQLRTTALNMRHGNYQRWNTFIYNEANVTTPVTFPKTYEPPTETFTGPTKTAIFDPVYDGRTGLEYFRDRMGYRLVLRDANASEWVKQNGTLKFEGKIQNVGFGNVVNQKNVSVILKSKTGSESYIALTSLDARDWITDEDGNGRPDNTAAWRDLNFTVYMGSFGNVPAGEYDIYLKINDPKEMSANKRCIQFANHSIWDSDLGANLIGSILVK